MPAADDFDRFVAPPAEPRQPARLNRLGPALAVAVVVLLLAGLAALALWATSEDPSLQVPDDAAPIQVPAATEPD